MKTKKLALVAIVAVSFLMFNACEKNEDLSSSREIEVLSVDGEGVSTMLVSNYEETLFLKNDSLSLQNIDELLWMLEEEKMAHDLYAGFYDRYDLRIFDRISSSEETHFTAIKTYCDFNEIPYEISEDLGVFIDFGIQNLYDILYAEGSLSLVEALVTGAKVEEYDIKDLMTIIETTTNEDLLFLYNNLLIGSRNHLRAFYRQLQNNGINYTPFLLDQSLFDEIINSGHERGQTCRLNSGENGNQNRHQNRRGRN